MISIKKIFKAIQETLENEGKARALASLRALDRRTLVEYGFSPEAIDQGIKAWPWRVEEQPLAWEPTVTETGLDARAATEPDHKEAA